MKITYEEAYKIFSLGSEHRRAMFGGDTAKVMVITAEFNELIRELSAAQPSTPPVPAVLIPGVPTEDMLGVGAASLERGLKLFGNNYTQITNNIWEDMYYEAKSAVPTPPSAEHIAADIEYASKFKAAIDQVKAGDIVAIPDDIETEQQFVEWLNSEKPDSSSSAEQQQGWTHFCNKCGFTGWQQEHADCSYLAMDYSAKHPDSSPRDEQDYKAMAVRYPSGVGTLIVADPDVNGVVIVRDESGEYRRVAQEAIAKHEAQEK